jgi:hypothetical protein
MPVSCCAPYVLDVSPYPPPPRYIPQMPEDSANIIDSISHRQPAHHPAYHSVHLGYRAVLIYPPSLGAYGPIPTSSGQALPAPPAEPTARNQTASSDDERPTAKLLKKERRAGGEDGGSKSSTKKSKRGTNAVSEAPTGEGAYLLCAIRGITSYHVTFQLRYQPVLVYGTDLYYRSALKQVEAVSYYGHVLFYVVSHGRCSALLRALSTLTSHFSSPARPYIFFTLDYRFCP